MTSSARSIFRFSKTNLRPCRRSVLLYAVNLSNQLIGRKYNKYTRLEWLNFVRTLVANYGTTYPNWQLRPQIKEYVFDYVIEKMISIDWMLVPSGWSISAFLLARILLPSTEALEEVVGPPHVVSAVRPVGLRPTVCLWKHPHLLAGLDGYVVAANLGRLVRFHVEYDDTIDVQCRNGDNSPCERIEDTAPVNPTHSGTSKPTQRRRTNDERVGLPWLKADNPKIFQIKSSWINGNRNSVTKIFHFFSMQFIIIYNIFFTRKLV